MTDISNVGTQSDAVVECRACLSQIRGGMCCVDLFCAWKTPWPGMGLSMAEDLAKLTGIQISVVDPCSKMICQLCSFKLQDSLTFMLTVQNSDVVLRKRHKNSLIEAPSWPKPIMIDKNLSNDVIQDMEVENIKQEVLTEDECDINENDTCRDTMLDTLDIKIEPEEMTQQHVELEYNNSLQAVEENQTLSNGDAVIYEQLEVLKEEPTSDDETDVAPDIQKDCMLCLKTFQTVKGLKAHVIAVHSYESVTTPKPPVNRSNECAICNKCFETRSKLFEHETCHSKFACYVCDARFDSLVLLSRHRSEQCARRIAVPKLKTLDDVRRIAGNKGTKTLHLFDLNIPLSRISAMKINEKATNIRKEKQDMRRKKNKELEDNKNYKDIVDRVLNEKVMSVVVNVRLPCDNVVQPKKEPVDEENSVIPKQEPIESPVPKIEPIAISEADKPQTQEQTKAVYTEDSTRIESVESHEVSPAEPPITQTELTPKSKPKPETEKGIAKFLRKLQRKSLHKRGSKYFRSNSLKTRTLEENKIKNKTDKNGMNHKMNRMMKAGIDWKETAKDALVTKTKVSPLCPCRKKCSLKIPEEFRQRFFDYYWSLNKKEQQKFIHSLIECKILFDKMSMLEDGQRERKCTFTYYLKLDNDCYDICKGCFISTIGEQITAKLINICRKIFKTKLAIEC